MVINNCWSIEFGLILRIIKKALVTVFYDFDEIICGHSPRTQIMVVIREALKQGVGTPKAKKDDAFCTACALVVITV